ncbi:hypothetical protein BJF88_05780 [Cellulosimicrobium sp. CUA-896]|nr:hypothetical protein BJF88_05780 [Cellulosimicrobium sp. CUA-896]
MQVAVHGLQPRQGVGDVRDPGQPLGRPVPERRDLVGAPGERVRRRDRLVGPAAQVVDEPPGVHGLPDAERLPQRGVQVGEHASEVGRELGEGGPLAGVRAREVEPVASALDELAEDREVGGPGGRGGAGVVGGVPRDLEPRERTGHAGPAAGRGRAGSSRRGWGRRRWRAGP